MFTVSALYKFFIYLFIIYLFIYLSVYTSADICSKGKKWHIFVYINSADIYSIFSGTSAHKEYGIPGQRSLALYCYAVCIITHIYNGGFEHSSLPNLGNQRSQNLYVTKQEAHDFTIEGRYCKL